MSFLGRYSKTNGQEIEINVPRKERVMLLDSSENE